MLERKVEIYRKMEFIKVMVCRLAHANESLDQNHKWKSSNLVMVLTRNWDRKRIG